MSNMETKNSVIMNVMIYTREANDNEEGRNIYYTFGRDEVNKLTGQIYFNKFKDVDESF